MIGIKLWLVLLTIFLVLSFILSCALFCFYRKLQKKNRDLSLRIRIQEPEIMPQQEILLRGNSAAITLQPDMRHNELFLRLHTYLLTDRNFAKPDMDTQLLVAELSTNRNYLFEAVKVTTGKTLQEYINTLRLKEAKHLLETTDEIIESVSEMCGYSSVRTFYRLFRSHYHVSPSTYRKMLKETCSDKKNQGFTQYVL